MGNGGHTLTLTEQDFDQQNYIVSNKQPILSIDDYLKYIQFIRVSNVSKELWFRGQTTEADLIPGIYRKAIWKYDSDKAKSLADEFIHKAKIYYDKKLPASKWEWYHLMQHYGLPTRLLDWTEGYLIALYFAVRNTMEPLSPCVWVIDPYLLNKLSTDKTVIYYTDKETQDESDKVINKYIEQENTLPLYPAAFYPPYIDERLKTQKSCFTVHGKYLDGFKKLHARDSSFKIYKLRINKNEACLIKEDLHTAGISESTLFPDLEGFARELKFRHLDL